MKPDHAIQYAQGYTPLKIRNAIIPLTNIGSRMVHAADFAGIAFLQHGTFGDHDRVYRRGLLRIERRVPFSYIAD